MKPTMKHTSPYDQVISTKRTWTPVEVKRGALVDGGEDPIFRGLALRDLELPVATFLGEGLSKELPKTPGVEKSLQSNIKDEINHDRALGYVAKAHGTIPQYEKEGSRIIQAWIDDPSHPILKAAILERSVFFVLLPIYRFFGDAGIRTTSADISRDERAHVAIHSMVCSELGIKSTESLNQLRRATVAWVVDGLGTPDNKYLNKDFWIAQSDSLYAKGTAPGLQETQRARVISFFEHNNVDLPSYV